MALESFVLLRAQGMLICSSLWQIPAASSSPDLGPKHNRLWVRIEHLPIPLGLHALRLQHLFLLRRQLLPHDPGLDARQAEQLPIAVSHLLSTLLPPLLPLRVGLSKQQALLGWGQLLPVCKPVLFAWVPSPQVLRPATATQHTATAAQHQVTRRQQVGNGRALPVIAAPASALSTPHCNEGTRVSHKNEQKCNTHDLECHCHCN